MDFNVGKKGVALYKGIEFCTKFLDLNWGVTLYKGCTIHEVLRYIEQLSLPIVAFVSPRKENWFGLEQTQVLHLKRKKRQCPFHLFLSVISCFACSFFLSSLFRFISDLFSLLSEKHTDFMFKMSSRSSEWIARFLGVTEAVVVLAGIPLVYELDADLKPVKHYYLASEEQVCCPSSYIVCWGLCLLWPHPTCWRLWLKCKVLWTGAAGGEGK